jgi:hypothetical protein
MSQTDVNAAAKDYAQSLRQAYTTVLHATIAAQERNVKLAQNIFECGIDELRTQTDTARDVVQSVTQQTAKQRETLETLACQSVSAYMDSVQNAASLYVKGLEAIRQPAK